MASHGKKPIQCYSAVSDELTTEEMVRESLRSFCNVKKTTLFSKMSQIAKDDVPKGDWTVAFAPRMLKDETWVMIFANPKDPLDHDVVWLLYPNKEGFFLEGNVKSVLEWMVEKGQLKLEKVVEVQDDEFDEFELMVNQAMWAAENTPFQHEYTNPEGYVLIV